MTLKSFIYTEKVVGLQIIHEAWRLLWDYLVRAPTSWRVRVAYTG